MQGNIIDKEIEIAGIRVKAATEEIELQNAEVKDALQTDTW